MVELTISSSMENAPPEYFSNFLPPRGLLDTILEVTRRQAAASSWELRQAERDSGSSDSRNLVMQRLDRTATFSSKASSLTRLTIQQWTASSCFF